MALTDRGRDLVDDAVLDGLQVHDEVLADALGGRAEDADVRFDDLLRDVLAAVERRESIARR